jgi:predicted TPR repeat methyltransferase
MLVRARLEGTGDRLARVCGTLECLRPHPTFDLVTAIDDVVAYVGAQEGGLARFLGELAPRVRPGGLFLFDFITPDGSRRYTFRNSRTIPAGRIVADSRGHFDRAARTLSVDLTLETPDHVAHERHVMRLHSQSEIQDALRRAGFEIVVVTDLYEGDGVSFEAGRPSYDVLARRR